MKIYTKTGDNGTTSLFDGTRVSKSNLICDVLGEMDELSTRIGMLRVLCPAFNKFFIEIQKTLQDFNSYIATVQNIRKLPELNENLVIVLEQEIDKMEEQLPVLTKFIIPGINITDCHAHLCRTQARKAERFLTRLILENLSDGINHNIPPLISQFLNRLSDFFFVFARWLAKDHPDIIL